MFNSFLAKFLKPLLVYGGGMVIAVCLLVIVEYNQHRSTGLSVADLISYLKIGSYYLIVPMFLGTYVHRKLSYVKYAAGLLSGMILGVLSAVFVASMFQLLGVLVNDVKSIDVFSFMFYLAIGVVVGIPLCVVLGGLFHRYIVTTKRYLQ